MSKAVLPNAAGDRGFLSRDLRVDDLVAHRGNIHHIFLKAFLKRRGLTRGSYNQIANYVYMQAEINIKLADKAPCLEPLILEHLFRS